MSDSSADMYHELPVLDGEGDADPSPSPASSDAGGGDGAPSSWRSLEERRGDPEFERMAEGEFAPGATDGPDGTSRRRFLQIMGASIAMAGMSACRKPAEKILPYTRMPEEVVPGESLYYATALPMQGVLRPVLVESHEGRPTKVEGNPDHPMSGGSTGVYEQASVLTLYDPDRSREVRRNGEAASWEAFRETLDELRAESGRLAVVAEPSSSPTRAALRERLGESFDAVDWVSYEAGGQEVELLGTQMAFGQPLRPLRRFSQAEVIVSLGADFLGPAARNHPHATAEFADSRRLESPEDSMSRLYAVESNHTLTGGKADHRLSLKPSEVSAFAAALAARMGVEEASDAGSEFAEHEWVDVIAEDLAEAGSAGLLLAGEDQPPVVHALCEAVNQQIGAAGTTVEYLDVPEEELSAQESELAGLVERMNAGEVDALLTLGTNPVYDAPAELDFAGAMEQVGTTVHHGLWFDETAEVSDWQLPASHYLESWGDGRAFDGTLSVVQPLIAPLYESRSDLELLELFAVGEETGGHDLVRQVWNEEVPGELTTDRWRRIIHDGLMPDSGYEAIDPGAPASLEEELIELEAPTDELEIVFQRDPHLLDGRYANNAWMQEQPDPVTKLTWDNAALMSPSTAEELGVDVELSEGTHYADVVELATDHGSIELPVWVVPGHAAGTVTVYLGYGRDITTWRPTEGKPAIGPHADIYEVAPLANGVGANAYVLKPSDPAASVTTVSVSPTGETQMMASTQDHQVIEGRHMVRGTDLEHYRENPEFASEYGIESPSGQPWEEYPSLWEGEHPSRQPEMTEDLYADQQWGMTIDMNTCTGCGVCITACQSENNIQVVGKEEVSNGREMHWIRLDRYYTGDDPEEAGMVMQAVTCMHCENAPCESVCPVAATSHSADGINEMTYNRCIGTRYCANNCPYKVRRFNYYNWTNNLPDTVGMAQNPDVTMRFRGVMEKCTYCVQRVREVGQEARNQDRKIRDGEVQTACQQACPAEAIAFGDVSDPDTEVSRKKASARNYEMLAELATKPRTSYLARVDNPNPRLQTEEESGHGAAPGGSGGSSGSGGH